MTAGLILQLLVGSDIIKLNMGDSADRAIFGSATKFLTMIVIVGESVAYILGGALGALTPNQALVIFVQLFIASIMVLLLDEMIQKGWGIGSGVSLFILAGVCQTVMWYTFSPVHSEGLGHVQRDRNLRLRPGAHQRVLHQHGP